MTMSSAGQPPPGQEKEQDHPRRATEMDPRRRGSAAFPSIEGRARYHWPGVTWEHSLTALGQDSVRVDLGTE
jgi:hypothetical protein